AQYLSEKGDILSLYHEAMSVSGSPSKVKLLVAAHHLRHQEWGTAQEVLDELMRQALAGNDQSLRGEVERLFRALILPLTIGKADASFDVDAHVMGLLERWAKEAESAESGAGISRDLWLSRSIDTARRLLEAKSGEVELCEPD